MKHIFFLIVVLFQINTASAQCIELHLVENFDTSSKTSVFYNLSFPHKDTGWAVNWGTDRILKTCNGGKTWEVQFSGFSDSNLLYPFDCHFINTKEGWVSNTGKKLREVLHTKDGGKTWEKQKSNLGPGLTGGGKAGRLFGLKFFNNKEGLLGADSAVWKTNDGGVTWKQKLQFIYPFPGYRAGIASFSFTDSIGYGCSASETTHKTTDRGETWSKLDNINDKFPSIGEGDGYYHLHSINKKKAVYVGPRCFRMTKDGGKTWQPITDEKNLYLRGLDFTDSLTGWVGLYVNFFEPAMYFFHTKDGGDTWKKVYLNGDYQYGIGLNDMQFVTKRLAYIVTNENFYTMYVDTVPLCKTKLLNSTDSLFKSKDKLIWKNAKNCTEGYKISVGTTPYGVEIYNKYDVKKDTFWQLPKALPSDKKVYVTITPYNQYGDGEVCTSVALKTEKTISTIDLPNEIANAIVYPNPFSQDINLQMRTFAPLSLQNVTLYNAAGQLVFQQKYDEKLDIGICTKNIDMLNLVSGTYFLHIQTDKGNWRTVVVRMRD
jgi:photosystem II stability/assembly factor-like uncharacterized protein